MTRLLCLLLLATSALGCTTAPSLKLDGRTKVAVVVDGPAFPADEKRLLKQYHNLVVAPSSLSDHLRATIIAKSEDQPRPVPKMVSSSLEIVSTGAEPTPEIREEGSLPEALAERIANTTGADAVLIARVYVLSNHWGYLVKETPGLGTETLHATRIAVAVRYATYELPGGDALSHGTEMKSYFFEKETYEEPKDAALMAASSNAKIQSVLRSLTEKLGERFASSLGP